MTEELLIVFVKNPVPGTVKTRIAAHIGDEAACDVYKQLLISTRDAIKHLPFDIRISYYDRIGNNDIWSNEPFVKVVQEGNDLGQSMASDLQKAFDLGYKKVCLIGSDIFDLSPKIIERAFDALANRNVVIGPATDGGYYLIGFQKKAYSRKIFKGIDWSTSTVFKDTLQLISEERLTCHIHSTLSDIDTVEDLEKTDSLQNKSQILI